MGVETSALDGGKWSASHHYQFTLDDKAPSTHLIGCPVGPRASLGTMEKV